jgi:hypothetical protein
MIRGMRPVLALVAVAALAACSAPAPPRPGPSAAAVPSSTAAPRTAAAPAPATTCPASATIRATGGNVEMQGVGTGGTSLFALFFIATDAPITKGQEVKIVWRMTGAGDLTMDAVGDRGVTTKPTWGPEAHGGSSYQRPGDEWGTGWVFPSAGCWTVHATRAQSGDATLKLRVA